MQAAANFLPTGWSISTTELRRDESDVGHYLKKIKIQNFTPFIVKLGENDQQHMHK